MAYRTLVGAEVVADHLHDWALVDCRYDLSDPETGRQQYRSSHIPGAVYASLSHDLSSEPTGTNGRHPLPSLEAMSATFTRLGIHEGTQVVAYDQDNGMFAARLWWMLRYLGHDAVAVLDGGWAQWTRQHRPVRSGDESRPPAHFVARPRDMLKVDVAAITSLVGDPNALLVDARAPERFEGRVEPLDRAAGHIPGAVNHFFKDNAADDGTMLAPEALRERFQTTLQGRVPEQVVMYCGSGVTACQNLLAMEHAGLSGSRLYPGSWSEWSADPQRPIETGTARRP